ncbi:MAG: hypothetical protein AB7D06_01250 [Pedobacter sp.]
MKTLVLFILVVVILMGCDGKQKEIELLDKIQSLESQLDECQNGADKIHAQMKLSYEKKDYELTKNLFKEMEKRHAESELFAESKTLYEKIIKIEKEKELEEKNRKEREKQQRLKALDKLDKKYDDVDDITWYRNGLFTHYVDSNLTSIYIGHKKNSNWLVLQMSYGGEDWIFFDRAFLSYDGNTKEINFDKYSEKKTENSGGVVWEWIVTLVDSDTESFLREFSKSNNAKMRLTGKYTKTRNLNKKERQGIIDVLNGYDVLKEESGMKDVL